MKLKRNVHVFDTRSGTEHTQIYAGGLGPLPRRVSLKAYEPHWNYRSTNYAQRAVQHVSSGELYVREDGQERRLTAGWTLLIFRGVAYELRTRARRSEGFVVFNSNAQHEPVNPRCIILEPHAELELLAREIRAAARARGPAALDVILAAGDYFAARAYSLAAERFERPRTTAAEWVRIAQHLIENNADSNRTLQDILAAVPISYEHLLRLFEKETGLSPRAFRIQTRVEMAKNLLLNSSDDITALAMQLGYSSSQHFATEFRRITRKTPSEFRASQART